MAIRKSTGRSNQGRGNKNKGGKTAGKGFVTPRANRSDKKAIGKGLAKMAAAVVPGGVAAKGVAGAAKLATMASKARTSGRAATEAAKRNPSMQSTRLSKSKDGQYSVKGGVKVNSSWGSYQTPGRPSSTTIRGKKKNK